jgi:ABC-type multidrug transport system fused ATPase/permease subunit
MWFFLKPYKFSFLVILVVSVIIGILETLNIAVLYPILNGTMEIETGQSSNFLLSIVGNISNLIPVDDLIIANCVLFIILAVFFFVFRLLYIFISLRVTAKVVAETKQQVFRKFLDSDYQFFVDVKQGELLYKTGTAPASIAVMLDTITKFTVEVIMSISIFILLFSLSWQGALLVILLGGVYFYFTRYLSSRVSYRSAAIKRQASEKENVVVTEYIMGIKPIKVFGVSSYWMAQFSATVNKFWAYWRQGSFWLQAPADMVNLVLFAVVAIVVIFIRLNNPDEFISLIPIFGTFVFAIMKLVPRLSNFGHYQMLIKDSLPNVEAIQDVLQDTTYSKIKNGTRDFPAFKSGIEFRNVKFTHKNREATLHDASFQIEKDKITAIVGASGTGKSTIVDLLLRLYDIDSGAIYIDGIDIKEYDIYSFLAKVGFVGQDTFIYNASVADNIRFGKKHTMEELSEATTLANADGFIQKLPEKFDTQIGDRGVRLSGGEKQRIAIARAIIKKPEILILDEATSSLDNISENIVQEAINRVSENCTTLMIAHRLQTIQHADVIHVLDQGRIVESGTHEQLLEHKGKYWELYSIQKG